MRDSLARVRLVAKREIVQRARSRAFRIGTALIALAAVGMVVLPSLLAGNRPSRDVGLVGEAPAALGSSLSAAGAAFDTKVHLERYPDVPAGERALRSGDVEVLLVGRDELVWKSESDPQLAALITTAIQAVDQREAVAELGLTPDQAAALLGPPALRSRSLDPAAAERSGRIGLAFAGLIFLLASISVYGGYLVTGVVEEKANRVVEVLLSRLRPHELLAGKVAGIGLVGLGQLVVAGGAAFAALVVVGTADLPEATPDMIGWVVFWFVVGFGFYSVVYATAGALASRQEDAQSVVFPVTMVLMVAYFLSFGAVESPDGLLARICSFLPPTAPLVMTVREAQGNVAPWEVVLSAALVIAATYGLIRLAGRVYAGAILRIGPRVKLRDAWRSAGG